MNNKDTVIVEKSYARSLSPEHLLCANLGSLIEKGAELRVETYDALERAWFPLKRQSRDGFFLVDKLNTHFLYDAMLLVGSIKDKNRFSQLSSAEKLHFWKMVQGFFVVSANLKERCRYMPRMAFNHDPSTWDRDGLQAIQRFHAHLTLVPNEITIEEEGFVHQSTIHKHSCGLLERRRYFDPAHEIGASILFDYISFFGGNNTLSRLTCSRVSPFDIRFNLVNTPENWNCDDINTLSDLVCSAELCWESVYRICQQWLTSENKNSINFCELELSQLKWLSSHSINLVVKLIKEFRVISPKTEAWILQNRSHSAYHLPLRGAAFTFSVHSDDSNEGSIISISPKIFSDSGGAGIYSKNGHTLREVVRKNEKHKAAAGHLHLQYMHALILALRNYIINWGIR